MYFVAGWNDGRMVARLRSVETKIHPSYAKASESLVGLTANVDAGRNAGESLQKMSQNLMTLLVR